MPEREVGTLTTLRPGKQIPGRGPNAPPTFFPLSSNLVERFLVERSCAEKLVQKPDWSPVWILWIGL